MRQALLAPGRAPLVNVSPEDAAEQQPLDLALLAQQWRLVRLLVGAGALTHSTGLAQARKQLQAHVPLGGPAPPRALPSRQGSIMSTLVRRPSSRRHLCPLDEEAHQ